MFTLLFNFSALLSVATDSNVPLKSAPAPHWALPNLLGPILAALAIAAIFGILVKCRRIFGVSFWAWSIWQFHFRFLFYLRQCLFRRNAQIICLEEYCSELIKARKLLAKLARQIGHDKCTILIKVFTKQLPSDWPLWFSDEENERILKEEDAIPYIERILNSSPLGKYAIDFNNFVQSKGGLYHGLSIDVKRYTVIDNHKGPTKNWEIKNQQLVQCLKSKWYNIYLRVLHGGSDKTAFLFNYSWDWPAWLSDSVFMGIRTNNAPDKWIWAFNTSYSPGEDVLIYRYHHLSKPGKTPEHFPIEIATSLSELAESDVPGAIPFFDLKKNVEQDAVEGEK